MASRKSFLSKPNRYIFPTPSDTHLSRTQEGMFELDEAELWTHNHHHSMDQTSKKGLPSSGSSRSVKRSSIRSNNNGGGGRERVAPPASSSLPVNIPDWSKILKQDYMEHRKWESDEEEDDEDEEEQQQQKQGLSRNIRVPPHEYLARTRGASLSVHEGIGRTLKGRDLRSVRNAIWKKVGFED